MAKRLLLAGLGLATGFTWSLLAGGQAPEPSPSPHLSVAFWNIQWFPGGRPGASRGEEVRQIKAVQHDLADLHPDIIGMEEVRDFKQAGVAVEKLPGFKVDVCATFPPREGQTDTQETTIASRLQPLSAWTELWRPNGPMVPPRGFAFAAYQIAPRQVLFFYCLHLKSNRGADLENIAMRQESIRQLRIHIDQMQSAYAKLGSIACIIGGDFNTSLDDRRFVAEKTLPYLIDGGFDWALKSLRPNDRVSLPAGGGFPAASFDHIFYRGIKLERAWIGSISPHASDHRPVAATFEIVGGR